ncbi:ornithine carbamoyltransferase [Falsibacillus albus]|uniref:Ornithine carbamoyltransferase n=1 Tax=Falsibacillus albus TaxID=2478915 RepID=A0A3L7K276_9BACI|nr:ornithine carbamoyltransferase [Falsibacillus albus]RLQ96081.1 ornithine carbamoyltransferase [Falsibacillus albus]
MSSIELFSNPAGLKGKDFLSLSQFNSDEITGLLESALMMKKEAKEGKFPPYLKGKTLGMIFEKSSTRTRVSFEVGMYQLGGNAIFLSSKDLQLGRGESVEDTAKVLSRYLDGIMIRTFAHKTVETFSENATIPIINGLTDLHHPTQVLADLLTILEHKGKLKGLNVCYIGDGNNNMCHSWIEGAVKMGMNLSIACPDEYAPDQTIASSAMNEARTTGFSIKITSCPKTAINGADVVITDVWTSMGQEAENEKRLHDFKDFQVSADLVEHATSDFIFLHCLPAHRGEEVTSEVIDGGHSVVLDEAENRLHAQKAILRAIMGDGMV